MKKACKKELSLLIPAAAPSAFFSAAVLSCLFLCFFSCGFSAGPARAETEETQTLSESSRLTHSERKIAELSYKTSKPSKIRSLSITPPDGIEPRKRAEKIEILSSEFDTEDETYWLSSGIFTLSDTAETTVCEFDPIEAQYIKIRILKCRGEEIYTNLGKVNIGLNTFKLAGVITDFEDGTPVTEAEVYINGGKSGASDKNGDFLIEECQYGSLEISIRASGYHDIKETEAVFTKKKIYMAFKMRKHSYTVCGRICGPDGSSPIALAGVKLIPANYHAASLEISANADTGEVKPLSRITDEFGCYYIEGVQSGSYEISASAEDCRDLVKSVYIDASKKYVINFIMKPVAQPDVISGSEDEDKDENEGEPH
jgi:hypothetical protein